MKIVKYIKMLLNAEYFDIIDLYYDYYHGDLNPQKQKEIITNFENSKLGIINCVYCLGEGWDFPLLDGVVFAENMSSNIRIVQSALRASRKNKNEPNKITKILLPILNIDDWSENNNSDLKKVKEIIYQMGLEDETISQKIKVFKIPICEKNPIKDKSKSNKVSDYIGIYDEDLTQNIRLKTMKRSILGISYEKAKQIISNYHIKSKEAYYELCEKDNRLSKEPEIIFKGKFTNWIDYLNIERIYYDLETCKNKVNEYLLNEIYIDFEFTNITKSLKILDNLFPPYDLWCEYYDIKDLTEIIKHKKNEELVEF
jgi:superfamily II DNA or RNA helicase